VAIFQHSLPFLQSESFHTHVGTIHRRAIGPLAFHNGTSAYSPSLACSSPDDRMSSSSTVLTRVLLSRNFPIRTQSSNLKGVRSQIHTSAPDRSPDPTALSVEVPNTTNPISIDTPVHCCQRNNAACSHCYPPITPKPSSIVVYLRKRKCCTTALL
jgi:hypothetical protein